MRKLGEIKEKYEKEIRFMSFYDILSNEFKIVNDDSIHSTPILYDQKEDSYVIISREFRNGQNTYFIKEIKEGVETIKSCSDSLRDLGMNKIKLFEILNKSENGYNNREFEVFWKAYYGFVDTIFVSVPDMKYKINNMTHEEFKTLIRNIYGVRLIKGCGSSVYEIQNVLAKFIPR